MKLFTKCSNPISYEWMTDAELLTAERKVNSERNFLMALAILVMLASILLVGMDHENAWLVVMNASYIAILDGSGKKLRKIRSEIKARKNQ